MTDATLDHARVLKNDELFAVFDRFGDIRSEAEGAQGLYLGDTRHLSALALLVDGRRPVLMSSTVLEDNAVMTADLATHTFRGSSRWPLTYKLADLPEGKAPGSLHLELRTSQLTEGNDWSVRVLLNGSIVYTANQPGSSETISLDIPLPSDIQKLENQLSVILVDNSPNQGICRAGREAVAQLLPATRLEAAANPEGDEQTLVAALAGAQGVLLSGPASASESTVLRASALLGEILPLDAPVHLTGTQPAQIRMVTGDQETTPAVADGSTGAQAYIVAPNADESPGTVTVTPMKDWPAGQQPEPGSLIVTW